MNRVENAAPLNDSHATFSTLRYTNSNFPNSMVPNGTNSLPLLPCLVSMQWHAYHVILWQQSTRNRRWLITILDIYIIWWSVGTLPHVWKIFRKMKCKVSHGRQFLWQSWSYIWQRFPVGCVNASYDFWITMAWWSCARIIGYIIHEMIWLQHCNTSNLCPSSPRWLSARLQKLHS